MIKIDKLSYSHRRTIQLQINQAGELVVRAPLRCPMKTIEQFIAQKEDWIVATQAKILIRQEKNTPIYDNFQLLLFGKAYNIVLVDDKKIEFNGDICRFPRTYCNNFNHYVMLHYKKLAKRFMPNRVEFYSNIMGKSPLKLRFSNTKTSWGSCNGRQEVALNWRLMMVDELLIDYVIVHELSHLFQMNHSSKFWSVVESVLPNYKTLRNNLKKNDYLLSLYRN